MLAWWPFLLAILFPFALDGLARRKIKQSNFDYSSPSAHRYSFFALFGILYPTFRTPFRNYLIF